MKTLRLMIPFVLGSVFSVSVSADFVYEAFDYPSDRDGQQLSTKGDGGVGWATSWQPGAIYARNAYFWPTGGSLTSGDLAVSGNSVMSTGSDGLNGIVRTTLQSFMGDGIGTRFLSFLIRPNVFGASDFGGLYIHGTNDLFLGKGGTFTTWGMETRGGTGVVASTVTVTAAQTALLVLKMESSSVGADKFTLYVNPTLDQGEPTSALTKYLDVGTANMIALYTSANFSFDEIRIGDSFEAVTPTISSTPEPSAILLGAMGLSPLLAWRARKRLSQGTSTST